MAKSFEFEYRPELCINCSECLSYCPVEAISLDPLQIDPDACIGCDNCLISCRLGALVGTKTITRPATTNGITWAWTDNYKDYTHTYKLTEDSEPITKTFRLRQLKAAENGNLNPSSYDSYAIPPTSFGNFGMYFESNEYEREYGPAYWVKLDGAKIRADQIDYSTFNRADYSHYEEPSMELKAKPSVLGLQSLKSLPDLYGWFDYKVYIDDLGPWVNEDASITAINASNLIGDSSSIAIFQTTKASTYARTVILKGSSFLFVNKASIYSSYYLWNSSVSCGLSTTGNLKILLMNAKVANFYDAKPVQASLYFALATFGSSLKTLADSLHCLLPAHIKEELKSLKGDYAEIEHVYALDRSNSSILGSVGRLGISLLMERPIKAKYFSSASAGYVFFSTELGDESKFLGVYASPRTSKHATIPMHGITNAQAPTSLPTTLPTVDYTAGYYDCPIFYNSINVLQRIGTLATGNSNNIQLIALSTTPNEFKAVTRFGYITSTTIANTPNKNFSFRRLFDEQAAKAYKGFLLGSQILGGVYMHTAKCLYKRIASNINYKPTTFDVDTTYDNADDKKVWEDNSFVEITSTSKTIKLQDSSSVEVYQIKALKDFESCGYKVKEGDLGGWVSKRVCVDTRDKVWLDEASYVIPSSYLGGELLFLNTQIDVTSSEPLDWEVLKVFCMTSRLRLDNVKIRSSYLDKFGGHSVTFVSLVYLRDSELVISGDWCNVYIGFDNFSPHRVSKNISAISLNGDEFSNCPNFFIKNSDLWQDRRLFVKGKLIKDVYNKDRYTTIYTPSISWESWKI